MITTAEQSDDGDLVSLLSFTEEAPTHSLSRWEREAYSAAEIHRPKYPRRIESFSEEGAGYPTRTSTSSGGASESCPRHPKRLASMSPDDEENLMKTSSDVTVQQVEHCCSKQSRPPRPPQRQESIVKICGDETLNTESSFQDIFGGSSPDNTAQDEHQRIAHERLSTRNRRGPPQHPMRTGSDNEKRDASLTSSSCSLFGRALSTMIFSANAA